MKPLSRRDLLGRAGGLASTMAMGLPLEAAAVPPFPGEAQQRRRKLKVIVTGGHPGDPEYGC
jgi:hypothetical protein